MEYDKLAIQDILFADFDGVLWVEYLGSICYAEWDGMHDVKYRYSWDWAMRVWSKFRDLKFTDETKSKLHANYVARLAQDIAYGTLDEFCHNLSYAIRWHNEAVKSQ